MTNSYIGYQQITFLLFILFQSTVFPYVNSQLCATNSLFSACVCSKDKANIDCSASKYNNSKELKFDDANLQNADFSFNSIENLKFGDSESKRLRVLSLSSNKIKQLVDGQFKSFGASLIKLDLSNNQIESIDNHAFDDIYKLEVLNLSNAFSKNLRLSKQLCPLQTLKVLDLSNADLESFTLDCWESHDSGLVINIKIEELYLRNVKNLQTSWSNWYKYIGKSLKVLDLTNTNLKTIDSTFINQLNLKSLTLSSNKDLDKSALISYLKSNTTNLDSLIISNISANNNNLGLNDLLNLNLRELTISDNEYTDDLNAYMSKIIKLKAFVANNNKFTTVSEYQDSLKTTFNSANLERLELSKNHINSSLLYYVRNINTMRYLDLSINRISLSEIDLTVNDLIGMFSNMKNISYIDFSHNHIPVLYLYFAEDQINPIEKIDFSSNAISRFCIIPFELTKAPSYPFNVKNYDTDIDKTEYKRYMNINKLDLSENMLSKVNMAIQFQSIKTLKQLDLSFNPIKTVDKLSYERKTLVFQTNSDIPIWNQNNAVDAKNLFCINEIYLNNCGLSELSSLEFACMGKLDLSNNLFKGAFELKLSKFTLKYLKYIDLQSNNLTSIAFSVSESIDQPSITSNELTYIDVKSNKYFECTCNVIDLFDEQNDSHIGLLNDCDLQNVMESLKCNELGSQSQNGYKSIMNKKLYFLTAIICVIITVLSVLILYSLVSDIRNINFYTIRNTFYCCKNKLISLTNGHKDLDESNNNTVGGSGGANSRHSNISYRKLDENDDHVDLNV